MLKDKFIRAMKENRIFLVPANHTPQGVTKVRMYLINELYEIERVNVETDVWDNKFKYYSILKNLDSLNPVFVLLASICNKLGIDSSEIDTLPKIL